MVRGVLSGSGGVADITSADVNAINAVNDHSADNTGAANTHVALQAAIDAASAAKMPLVLPPGSYRVGADLITANDLTIYGYGATLLRYDSGAGTSGASNPVLHVKDSTNVAIYGLSIDGRKASFTGSQWAHNIDVEGSSNVVLRDLVLLDANGDGLIFNDMRNNVHNRNAYVENVFIKGSHRGGVGICDLRDGTFVDVIATQAGDEDPCFGIDVEPDRDNAWVENLAFYNCSAVNNQRSGFYVTLRAAPTKPQRNIRWYGGRISHNAVAREDYDAGGSLEAYYTGGNIGTADYFAGVSIWVGRDVLIDGAEIRGNGNEGVSVIRGGDNITIRNCTITGNIGQGIQIKPAASNTLTNVHLTDNIVADNSAEGAGAYDGIVLDASNASAAITDVWMDGNQVSGSHRYGLNCAGTLTGLRLGANKLAGSTAKTNGLTRNRVIPNAVLPLQFNGGGAEIADNTYSECAIPYDVAWLGWDFMGTPSGSITADVWVDTYANYPPADADSIAASDLPTITTATNAQDLAPTGWTQHAAGGSIVRGSVDSCTTIELATLYLYAARVG